MTATKEQVSRFFAGVEGDQDAGGIELLPTKDQDGAPPENLYLFQIDEEETEVRHSGDESKNPGHPYINTRNVVMEPEEFEDRSVFGLFYFPADPAEDASDKDLRKYDGQRERFVGQVDAILGKGACAALQGDTLEELMEELCGQLQGATFVGTVGVEKGRNGYKPKNRITNYAMAETWGQEDE